MATETRSKVENGSLDPTDRRILSLLQDNAKMPQAKMAKAVGLTAPSVNERIRKLERAGYIRGYVTLLDERKLGHDVTAFVEVFIEHPRHEPEFIEVVRGLDEVQECHHITGDYSLLLKIRVRDTEALQQLLLHRINALEGVRQTRTVIVLSTSKEESFVPTGAEEKTP